MYLEDGRQLRLLDVIGRGTFATVSRALLGYEGGVERVVAAKLFGAVSSEDIEQIQESLRRAARRTACIDHPNVVRTYDCSMWHTQPMLLSELVAGVSLASLLETYASYRRRLPLDLALFIAVEVAEGLAAAHRARDYEGADLHLIHHALSSREVLLSWNGEVKISDFETSVVCAGTSSVRSMRSVASRVSSMAPEVAQGDPADARSDVFSFGVLLRELVGFGSRFVADIAGPDAIRLAREGFVEPISFQPNLPRELESVIARALEVDPAERYPNAGALASDLRPIALAMGVGDGRYFLRKTLEREWEAEDVTGQVAVVAQLPEDEQGEEGKEAENDEIDCFDGLKSIPG